ncbi:ORF1 [torque teno Delphinidae virus 30]
MPYGYYRGRARYRRRVPRYGPRYRWRWRARRQRYWSWHRRRALNRWVRGLRYRYSRNRRRIIRKKRRLAFIRWNRRWKYKLPKALKLYNPPYVRTCNIRGYFPLLYFTGKQVSYPFIDPLSHTYEGGGIAFNDFSLNKLYLENQKLRNKWSFSNYGFEFARFIKAKFTLYRHPSTSYMVKFFQGTAIHKNQTYMDIHPGYLYLQRKRYLMASNERVPYRKRFKKKRIYLRPPKNMHNDWYDMDKLGQTILVRLGVTVADFLNAFQSGFEQWGPNPGNFYYTLGYYTPDRRTLTNYKQTFNPLGDKYSVDDINTWGPSWETWGGPINIKLPYNQHVEWCSHKFPELIASAVVKDGVKNDQYSTYADDLRDCWNQYDTWITQDDLKNLREKFQNKGPPYVFTKLPAYLITTDRVTRKFMSKICGCIERGKENITELNERHIEQTRFGSLTAGLPSTTLLQHPSWSFSSHRTNYRLDTDYIKHYPKNQPTSQLFWPGRYNSNYDTGKGNVVYGCYIHKDQLYTSFQKFVYENTGPGWGILNDAGQQMIQVREFFKDVPYWLTFYGHTYKTFLAYLNQLDPDIFKESKEQKGYIAIAIKCFPAEKVASGPFANGYAPMRYLGLNCEYFSASRKPRWTTYWPQNTNQPPVDPCGNIDTNAWIFCLLRDGRNCMYGSSLEGSLFTINNGGAWFCSTKQWTNQDDVAVLAKSGPFIPNPLDPRMKEGVVNLFGRYTFTFQWGGYTPPPRTPAEDTRGECKENQQETEMLPRPFRLRRSAVHHPLEPEHPTKVYHSAFYPLRDTTPGGTITESAWQRLTSRIPFSAAHLGLGINGRPVDNKLFVAYSKVRRGRDTSPSSNEEEEEGITNHQLWPFVSPDRSPPPETQSQKEALAHLLRPRKRRSTDTQGIEDCLPCRRRRDPQSHGRPRELSHRLGVLQSRQRVLRRLIDALETQKLRDCDSE